MRRNTVNFLIDVLAFAVGGAIVVSGLVLRYVLTPGTGGRLALLGWGRHDWGGFHFWLSVVLGVLVIAHVALHWTWVCMTTVRLFRPGAAPSAPGAAWRRNLAGGMALVALSVFLVGFVWLARANVGPGSGGGHGGGAGHGRMGADADHYEAGGGRHGAGWGRLRQEAASTGCDACNGAPTETKAGCPAKGVEAFGDRTDRPAEGHEDAGSIHDGGTARGGRGAGAIRGSTTLGEAAAQVGVGPGRLAERLGLPPDTSPDERMGHLTRQLGLQMSELRRRILDVKEPDGRASPE
jgi:hypothetical protein